MKTSILKSDDNDALSQASKILLEGDVVAIPTETVYGLAALATNADAIKKIFELKGRPADNPLIVHISNMDQLHEIACDISETAYELMDKFWPGPLTLILKKKDILPDITTAGLDSVAVRMPSLAFTRELISITGPLAAPSANLSGKPSTVTAQHVYDDLSGRLSLIIDGGSAEVGVESTVVDVTKEIPELLRPGGVSLEELQKVIPSIRYGSITDNEAPKSPGMKYKHYSPMTRLIGIDNYDDDKAHKLERVFEELGIEYNEIALISFEEIHIPVGHAFTFMNPEDAAHNLFSVLRELDELEIELAVVILPPEKGLFHAVRNRLLKASHEIITLD